MGVCISAVTCVKPFPLTTRLPSPPLLHRHSTLMDMNKYIPSPVLKARMNSECTPFPFLCHTQSVLYIAQKNTYNTGEEMYTRCILLLMKIEHIFYTFNQCWGYVTFWCGSGSGSSDPYLWLMDRCGSGSSSFLQ